MSLRPEELDVIKYQLGVPLTRVGAEPYIQFVSMFDQVIQPYLYDNSTTLTGAVIAGATSCTLAANPTAPNNPTQLVFQLGTSIVVDVGASQETTTIALLSGLNVTASFANAHSAGCPVWPNGAEWTVRAILARIVAIETQLNSVAPKLAGLKQVDEIQAYSSGKIGARGGTRDTFESLIAQRDAARDDLASAIGYVDLHKLKRQSSSSRLELY